MAGRDTFPERQDSAKEDGTHLPRERNRRGIFRKGRRKPLAEEGREHRGPVKDSVGDGPEAGEPQRPSQGPADVSAAGQVAVTRPGTGSEMRPCWQLRTAPPGYGTLFGVYRVAQRTHSLGFSTPRAINPTRFIERVFFGFFS